MALEQLVAPGALVAAPARTPLPFGLGSVVAWRDGTGDRWQSGVGWDADTCAPAMGREGPVCFPNEGRHQKVFVSNRNFGEALPFVVYGYDKCSIGGSSFSEAQERANRHLLQREEARAEQALWTGDLGNVPNFSGAYGAAPPIPFEDTFADPWSALAALESQIARTYGALGVIHMTVRAASLLLSKGSLDKKGGRLFTEYGHSVIAGAGYPAGSHMVATPALFGYRSEAFTSSSRPGDLLDRGTNDMYAIAERTYLIGYDPCPIFIAEWTDTLGTVPAPPELTITLGTMPSSPIPDGTDVTAIAQTNIAAQNPLVIWFSLNGGPATLAGEMTQVDTLEWVFNADETVTTVGDVVEAWAVTTYFGEFVESNHVTITVVA